MIITHDPIVSLYVLWEVVVCFLDYYYWLWWYELQFHIYSLIELFLPGTLSQIPLLNAVVKLMMAPMFSFADQAKQP